MNRKAAAVVGAVALAAGVAAALAARAGGGGGGPVSPGDPAAGAGAGSRSEVAPGTGAPPDHELNDTGHGEATGDDDPAALVWYQQLSTLPLDDVTWLIERGVGSDLPDGPRVNAAEVASRFVVADLSGEGRDRFPTWWGGERSTAAPELACCTDVEVVAAGAAGYPAEEPLVLALVVWSATPVDSVAQFDAWESFVFLHPAPGGGGFTPVDPSTVESWRPPAGLGQPAG
jgi:hypothetical protein